MKEETIPYCTSHYTTDFAKKKAKELRNQGYTVKFGYYIKEEGNTYCKIYLVKNFEYYILKVLTAMEINIRVHGVENIKERYAENVKSLCLEHKRSARIEIDDEKIYAIVKHKGKDKELFVSVRG